jgi:hypothetical protein
MNWRDEIETLKRGDGWLWSRYVIKGTALEPWWIYTRVRAGEPIADVAKDFGISVKQAQACLDFRDYWAGFKTRSA